MKLINPAINHVKYISKSKEYDMKNYMISKNQVSLGRSEGEEMKNWICSLLMVGSQ